MKRRATCSTGKGEALKTIAALAIAFCIWLPSLHLFYSPHVSSYRSAHGISKLARELAAVEMEVWSNPKVRFQELHKLHAVNPEWDFMSRTYTVLAFANMAMRDPSFHRTACKTMDAIITDTLKQEKNSSFYYFLLPYARESHWAIYPPGSIFVDGEIAIMIAARRMVEEKLEYKPLLEQRIRRMTAKMAESPVLVAESYPNECWIFCNTVALAAIRMADVLDGTDHSEFLASWIRIAEKKLIDPKTGLLISAFAVDGRPVPCGSGGEGSSIWMACNMLQIVDNDFAGRQYRLAKKALSAGVLGFGYALEWPRGSCGGQDVDSGPIAPLLNISPSSTGLAAVGAAAFDDNDFFRGIITSIEIGGMPVRDNGQLKYCASNLVGDAVLLYAMTEGPLWNAVRAKIH